MVARKKRQFGFTLLELLTVVAILMILAAIAIPAYTSYVRRSKSSEVSSNLNSLFKSAATYYSMERSGAGMDNTALVGACTVTDGGPDPATPGAAKQKFAPPITSGFAALGFTVADLVYYSYGIDSVGAACGNSENQPLYTFYANGDLDDDGVLSTFEMAVASDNQNLLYHGVGFYISNESE